MITVHIRGGLGNQLFQYACGRALTLRHGNQLQLTRSDDQGEIDRSFSLLAFNIIGKIVSPNEVPLLPKFISRLKQKLTRNFYVNFQPAILKISGNTYLDGYFQSEKYFADSIDTIRQDFKLKEPLVGKAREFSIYIQSKTGAVSIHVRRGDYITHPDFGGIVNNEYYTRAITKIRESVKDTHFFVFSDDINWCKENLKFDENVTFVSNPDLKDYEELILMSLCKHHIIANSSFSWWGAWLDNNPEKIVIAPKQWSNNHEDWYRDIIPATWTRL